MAWIKQICTWHYTEANAEPETGIHGFFTHFLNQSVINTWLLNVHALGGIKSLVEFMLPLCFSLMAGGTLTENDSEEDITEPQSKRIRSRGYSL